MTAQLLGPRRDHLRPVPTGAVQDDLFDSIYREHFDRLRRFVLGLTGQAALAEDVAQETLLRAYTRLDRIDLERPLWPWLKCVAVRLVVDNSRCQRREDLDPDPVVETATDTFDVTVERQLLSQALQALPTRQRVAVGLRYLENWKSAEVAAVLGLSRVAVEQLLLRARRRLSAEYTALGGDSSGLRVVLWPIVAAVAWLRERALRLRQHLGAGAGAQLPGAVDGMTQMVAVMAVGGAVFAGGVALAAPARDAAPPAVPAVHASAFHAEEVRAATMAGAAVGIADRVAPKRRPAASAPSSPGRVAPKAATRVTAVEVTTGEAVPQAPADSVAKAKKERTADALAVEAHMEIGTDEAGDTIGRAGLGMDCRSSTIGEAGCAATDAADTTVELP